MNIVIFLLFVSFAAANNTVICSMDPLVKIDNFEIPNIRITAGYYFNCRLSSCQPINFTARLNATKNFFDTLDSCQSICPGNIFQ